MLSFGNNYFNQETYEYTHVFIYNLISGFNGTFMHVFKAGHFMFLTLVLSNSSLTEIAQQVGNNT